MTDNKKQRFEELKEFYRNAGGINIPELICGDASNRKFYRVPEGILMDAPCTTEKNSEFVDIASRLQQVGIKAPQVLQVDYTKGFLLVTDLGGTSFADVISQCVSNEALVKLYKQAIDVMVELTKVQTRELPVYDDAFIKREDDICRDYYFKARDIKLTFAEEKIFKEAEAVWIKSDLEAPQLAMHRDFHSRNIMMPKSVDDGVNRDIALIDFQDMVTGPLGYDLASLLRDCYVELESTVFHELFTYAFNRYDEQYLHGSLSLEAFTRIVDLAGLQRHVKCLGIFNRLSLRDGKHGYLKNIPLVEKYVLHVASKYPELADFYQLMQGYVGANTNSGNDNV